MRGADAAPDRRRRHAAVRSRASADARRRSPGRRRAAALSRLGAAAPVSRRHAAGRLSYQRSVVMNALCLPTYGFGDEVVHDLGAAAADAKDAGVAVVTLDLAVAHVAGAAV